nr:hypothetical protein [Tanacetum cinerariifolium]
MIEGDENSKFFHGTINKKRTNLAVKGVMIEGLWVDDPSKVKDEFRDYFASRFRDPGIRHGVINFNFPNRLNIDQSGELEAPISRDEIRRAVWDCGENKSPRLDGFTFEFFRRFWNIVGPDLLLAVECVGNGMSTSFWHDQWLGDSCLWLSYPRLFALENNKVCTVATKMSAPFVSSLHRDVRGGEESAQLSRIFDLLDTVVLSNMGDHRFWDLNGDRCFRVKDVRRMLDDILLPKSNVPSRWVKQIPIKVNVLAWKISMDRLPTQVNLHRRGVQVSPISCPICYEALENLDHLLFCCDLVKDIARSICNWWGLVWNPVDSYRSWLS